MVTFPAAERHRPLAGTKLYPLMTEKRGHKQLAQLLRDSRLAESQTCDLVITNIMRQPLSHQAIQFRAYSG